MNRINRMASLIAAVALSFVTVPAGATEIEKIVFFGDSLSDTGNVWFATGGFPGLPYNQGTSGAPPEFTGGQWSGPDGPSWPSVFAARFGQTATPSLVPVPHANNFAWGGARTGINPDPTGAPWLDQQVALYLVPFQVSGTSVSPTTLVSIMIGGNDVANNLGDQEALAAGVSSIITQVTNLYAQGVRQFVIANVPDIGASPRFQAEDALQPGVAAFATAWTIQWNTALEAAIAQLQLPGAVISFFDFFSFAKDPELLAAFANTTDACLTEVSLCSDPASYFYWDAFHPSSTSHALVAEGVYETLVPSRLAQLLADVAGVGPGKSLTNKVLRAQDAYDRANFKAACGVLRGFSNQVRAQSGKKLTADTATALSADAATIAQSLGCR